jgi:hypothetical protein
MSFSNQKELKMDKQTFVNGYLSMLTETLESPQQAWSAFLDQRTGLFETLGSLPAERASTAPAPGLNTVCAHAEHTRFHLAATNAFLQGEGQKLDWAESWKVQGVDETQWRHLQSELRREYQVLRGFAGKQQTWDEQAVGGAIGLLAHVAYHLGALRQVVRFLQAKEQVRAGGE